VHHGVDQFLEVEALCQRGDEQRPGVGHETRLAEGHRYAVCAARYWDHRKCLLGAAGIGALRTPVLAAQEELSADTPWFSSRRYAVD